MEKLTKIEMHIWKKATTQQDIEIDIFNWHIRSMLEKSQQMILKNSVNDVRDCFSKCLLLYILKLTFELSLSI